MVPAIVLVELLAQTGGLAVGSGATAASRWRCAWRRSAASSSRGARGPGATLEARARLVGRMGGLYKIEGEVTADGVLVATGSVTLAEARKPRPLSPSVRVDSRARPF